MQLKALTKKDVFKKDVVLRVDFNCPIKYGVVQDTFRIDKVLPTFRFLLDNGAKKIVVLTHLGRPDGVFNKKESLNLVIKVFQEKLLDFLKEQGNVIKKDMDVALIPFRDKIEDCIIDAQKENKTIVFLENIRFWKEEEEGNIDFAKAVSLAGEVFVNDAFSVCHRPHASVSVIAQFLPARAGILLQNEVSQILGSLENPKRPAIAIVGGAKLETKIPILKNLLERYDKVLVGGLIAVELRDNTSLKDKLLNTKDFSKKLILPLGFIDKEKRDLDEDSIKLFIQNLQGAKTIFWNGPLGKFEEPPFDISSRLIGEMVAMSDAFKISGGGETNEMLQDIGIFDKIDFISTGGGAMLELIGGKKLPGLEVLKKKVRQ